MTRDSLPRAQRGAGQRASTAARGGTRDGRGEWVVGPMLHGGAALVGASRVHLDMHWASDVLLGAGVRTVTGLTTVRWQHGPPGNRLDRWLLPEMRIGRDRDVRLSWSVGGD